MRERERERERLQLSWQAPEKNDHSWRPPNGFSSARKNKSVSERGREREGEQEEEERVVVWVREGRSRAKNLIPSTLKIMKL